jgi:hypothetical protein
LCLFYVCRVGEVSTKYFILDRCVAFDWLSLKFISRGKRLVGPFVGEEAEVLALVVDLVWNLFAGSRVWVGRNMIASGLPFGGGLRFASKNKVGSIIIAFQHKGVYRLLLYPCCLASNICLHY